MKRLLMVLGTCIAVFALVACGSEADDFVADADQVCADYEDRFGESGNRGVTMDQIVDEMTFLSEVSGERQEALDGLEAPEGLAENWQAFQATGTEIIELNGQVIAAAQDQDEAAMNQAFAEFAEPTAERRQLAEEIGFEVCGRPVDPEVEETGTGPDDDLEAPEPSNSAEDVAAALVSLTGEAESDGSGDEAVDQADCDALAEIAHSDLGLIDEDECRRIARDFAGAEVMGVEEYGPAAVAELESEFDYFTVYLVLGDGDQYRYVGYVHNDGRGLRPAPEDNDAADVASEVVDSAGTAGGVASDLLAMPGESPVPVEMTEALADSGDVEPAPLGINQALAFYLVEAGDREFVLVLYHMPGGQGEYRLVDVHELQQG